MKEFIRKYKLNLSVCAYLVAVALAFYFLFFPLVDGIRSKADEIERKEIDAQIYQAKLDGIPSMEKKYVLAKDGESKLDVIVHADGEVDMIKELETMAGQTGNKIQFQVQDTADGAGKSKPAAGSIKSKLSDQNYLSMQIALEGSYDDLIYFLHKLENYKDYINVVSFSSEKIQADNGSAAPAANQPNPFAGSQAKSSAPSHEILNTILDVVVYLKK